MKKEDEIIKEVYLDVKSANQEKTLADSLDQIGSFIDQLVIEVSKEDIKTEEIVKNLISLRSFIEKSTFEYKFKSNLINVVNTKKKESQKSEELESQKELLEQDQ